MYKKYIILAVGAAALAACAPKPMPEPVTAEPVYTGKYGGPVETCRPAGYLVGSQYPASVPDCPQQCAPGSHLVGATAARPAVCVPDPTHEGSNGNVPTRTPNDTPTGANGATTAP